MARPPLELDARKIQELAALHCTMKEIAKVMDCSVDTLERRFADVIDKGRGEGKISLRRAQIKYALNGNATLLIFLGKQMLDQKENPSETAPLELLKSFDTMMNQLAQMQTNRHNDPNKNVADNNISTDSQPSSESSL